MVNKTLALVAIFLALLLVYVSTSSGKRYAATSQTTTVSPSGPYVVQPYYLVNGSQQYTVIVANLTPGSLLGNFSGVIYTATTLMVNNTVAKRGGNVTLGELPSDVPVEVYSLAYLSNSTASAQRIYDSLYAAQSNLSTSNQFDAPAIGDLSSGYKVSEPGSNTVLFMMQFTYNNVYARVGVFEMRDSNSTSVLFNASESLLQSIQGGVLTR